MSLHKSAKLEIQKMEHILMCDKFKAERIFESLIKFQILYSTVWKKFWILTNFRWNFLRKWTYNIIFELFSHKLKYWVQRLSFFYSCKNLGASFGTTRPPCRSHIAFAVRRSIRAHYFLMLLTLQNDRRVKKGKHGSSQSF